MQIVDARHRLLCEREHDVALSHTRGRRRAVGLDRRDQHAGGDRQMIGARDGARHRRRLSSHADVAAADAAVANEACRDVARRVARDRKAEALRRQNHRGIDPDDDAARRHERTAGVARVEARVGLDDVVHQPARAAAQRAAERADDAGGHRMMKAVRIANPDTDRARVAKRCPGEPRTVRRVDPHDREIRVAVEADHLAGRGAAVGHRDAQRPRALDDVAVGEDQPVGREEDARPAAVSGVDLHHRRPDCLDGPCDGSRVGIEEMRIVSLWYHGSIVKTPASRGTTRTGSGAIKN